MTSPQGVQVTQTTSHAADKPAPALSTFDAIMITVGIVIGAGIFQTPTLVAGIAGSPALMLAAWALGGVLSFIGALTYAELATTYPSAGGDYTFLTRAYGKDLSFLFAWARSTVICTGSIALIGFILGDYLTRLFDLGRYSSAMYAALATLALTAINLVGLRSSSRVQNALGILEVGGVLLVGIAGMTVEAAPLAPERAALNPGAGSGAFGLAMVFVLLTYGGWNEAAYVSAEVRGGARAVYRTLVWSIGVITAAYLLFVLGVLHGLGFEGLKASQAVGVDIIERALGPAAGQFVGVLVAISALTSMNSTMLVGARSNYAVANDWPVFGFMRHWRGERNTPVVGLLVQTAIALCLIAFGAVEKNGFSAMVEFTAPVFWFFFMLSGIAVFVLRRRDPQAPRPVRVPLYPIVPLIFVLTCAYLFYSSVVHASTEHAVYVALLVMASGAIVWLIIGPLRAGRSGPR
jgi:basic amino acid/polyamine antiporter, APA family